MWIIEALLVMVVSSLYFYAKQFKSSWEVKDVKVGFLGEQKYYYIIARRGLIGGLLVGVDCPKGFNFSLRKENFIDRWSKALGLTKETQLNRVEFDKKIYITSDDLRLTNILRLNTEIRDQLFAVMDSESVMDGKAKGLYARGGRLWWSFLSNIGTDEQDEDMLPGIARFLAPTLWGLSAQLDQAPPINNGEETLFFNKAVLMAVAIGFLANAIFQVFVRAYQYFPVIIDDNDLIVCAVKISACIVLLYLIVSFNCLKKSSRRHIVLFQLCAILLVGVYGSVYFGLHDYNVKFDNASGQVIESRIIHRYISKGSKRMVTHYHIVIDAWNNYPDKFNFIVSESKYDEFKNKKHVQFLDREGALGFRWVENIKPIVRN